MNARYFLNDLGIVNALGSDRDSILRNLLRGIAPGMQMQTGWLPDRAVMVGTVTAALPEWPPALAQFDCRNNRLLLSASQQIAPALNAAIERYGRERVAVVIGSSTSGIREGEAAYAAQITHPTQINGGEFPPEFDYRQQEIGTPALALAAYLDLHGVTYTLSTACSSSAKAFGAARNLLDMNVCDAVVVGGVDSLCKLTINGFFALDSLAQQRCNPFSANRDGINIGEAAAVFLLSREPSSIALAGVGESADAYHISAPEPDGLGAEAAMRAALADADLQPSAIDYINLHGTATPKNDEMESRAVMRVFGGAVPCSSTKPLTGHTLGAAGATEVGLCWLLLSALNTEAELPAQCWDGIFDPALPPIDLLKQSRVYDSAQDKTKTKARTKRFLSNSFAFGGSNCAVIIESGHDE